MPHTSRFSFFPRANSISWAGCAISAFAVVACGPALGAAAHSVWLEGESASSSDARSHPWYGALKTDDLSGGDSLAHWGDRPATASYRFEVPAAGSYVLWVRANPVGTAFDIKLGGGGWRQVEFDDRRETVNLAADGKVDLRFVAWVRAGEHRLAAGEHEMAVRFRSPNNNHGILDCLCLTTDAEWRPRGMLKPGERAPHWPAPHVTADNLDNWIAFIRPGEDELAWREVRWHHSLSDAAAEARELGRPVLLWAMNGHPCGET